MPLEERAAADGSSAKDARVANPVTGANTLVNTPSWAEGAEAVGAAESALPFEPGEEPGRSGPRSTPRHTVAVLGAHLGGSMLAAILAHAGIDVVLVDSPHDAGTPSGETTVPYTAEVFECNSSTKISA